MPDSSSSSFYVCPGPYCPCDRCQEANHPKLKARRDHIIGDSQRAEILKVLEPFARVWNSRPQFDVTKPFTITCDVGEFGAFADAAKLCAKLAKPEGE